MSKHTFKEWFMATRLWAFPASTMPIVASAGYMFWRLKTSDDPGFDSLSYTNAALALLAMVLFHAAGNLWSDVNDYLKKVDNDEAYCIKTLVSGQFSLREIRLFSLSFFVAAVISGLVLLYLSGPLTLWFGVAGLLFTLLYPFMKYRAMGDLDIFLTYGILPCLGTGYVMSGEIIPELAWVALSVSLITVAILHTNNMRDIHTDTKAGIHTFAMLIGHKASKVVYVAEVAVIPFVLTATLSILGIYPLYSLAVFLSLPIAIKLCRLIGASTRDTLNTIAPADGMTAQLVMVFALLLTASFIVGGVI